MTYTPHWFVGVDPGAKGAIAVLKIGDIEGKLNLVMDMPIRNGRVDPYPLSALPAPPRNFIAVIEKVHAMPDQGVTSMFNFGKLYGGLLTFFDYTALKLMLVSPRDWKGHYGLGSDKGEAIARADQVFGKHEMWHRTGKRGGAMLDENSGCAEAALLAFYGWKQTTND